MDKNFRLFGKISVIDILAVIAVIIGIMLLGQFAAPQTVTAGPNDTAITYTVELYRKRAGFGDKIQVGETLYDSTKGYMIGTIIDVYEEPYREDTPDFEAGIIRHAAVEGLSNVYVVVEASAQISDSATNIGQYEVMVGKEVFVKSRSFAGYGYVVGIER